MVETITNTNISSVLKEKEITVIDFWAEWCGPCRMLGPIINDVADKNNDVLVGKVNVDDNSDLSAKYGVRNIPTLVFVKNGEVAGRLVGVSSAVQIQKVIDSLK